MLDKTKIDNASFKTALEGSLRSAGLLAPSKASRYYVVATLLTLDQPEAGIDMTVASKVRYKIIDSRTGGSVFEEEIVGVYTAHLGDATIGTKRLRLATEGAARKSIEAFVEKLRTGAAVPRAVATAR